MLIKILENSVGFLVICLAGYVMAMIFINGDLKYSQARYNLYANFDNAGGLAIGGDVRIGGVVVGSITHIALNASYKAELALSMIDSVKVPEDSAAEILSDGLLGDKYVNIAVGSSDQFLEDNDEFLYTQSFSFSLEQLIGKLLFGVDHGDSKNNK